jgi:hypothetical protein
MQLFPWPPLQTACSFIYRLPSDLLLITTRLSFLSTHSLSTQSSDVPFFEQTQSLFPGSSVNLLDGTTFDIHITAYSVPRNPFDPPR